MKIILLCLILCCSYVVLANQICQPFGVRLFYGQSFFNPQSPQILKIYFNTQDQCQGSFLFITQNLYSRYVDCETTLLSVTNQTTFNTHVHSCSLINFKYTIDLRYAVFGKTKQGETFAFEDRFITVNLVDPNVNSLNQFLVFADWGKIVTKEYIPITDSLNQLVQNNRSDIHGIIINGDTAYDMATNQCQNYVDFLNMLSKISTVWPLMFTAGNHEHKFPQSYYLYTNSFALYNQTTKYIQSYRFKNFAYLSIDPYDWLYNVSTDQQNQLLVDGVTQQLKITKQRGLWSVAGTHYPLVCSVASQSTCRKDQITLKSLFDSFSDNGLNIYLAGHVHTYEREYPYSKGNILSVDGPYKNIKQIVSIVQGVAGNDNDIVTDPYEKTAYTVKNSYNQTGFGILSVHNEYKIEYNHYSTKDELHISDSVVIQRSQEGNMDNIDNTVNTSGLSNILEQIKKVIYLE